jgi:hypothetical protein
MINRIAPEPRYFRISELNQVIWSPPIRHANPGV